MINHDSVWRDHKTHLNSLIRLPVPEGSNRAESDGSDEQKSFLPRARIHSNCEWAGICTEEFTTDVLFDVISLYRQLNQTRQRQPGGDQRTGRETL